MTKKPKVYLTDRVYSTSFQEKIQESTKTFAQYAVIIDRLLAEFETYDKIKSLDIKEYAIKIFSELDQLKKECEEWKNKYYCSTTETKADLIKQIDQLKKNNEELIKFQKYWSKVEQKNLKLSTQNEIYKHILEDIKDFIEYEFYGENIWVKETILQKCEVLDEQN